MSGDQRIWRTTIQQLRTDAHLADELTFKSDTFDNSDWEEEQVHPHCPLISGTFTMEIGGLPIAIYDSTTNGYTNTDIPFSVSAASLRNALRQVSGF